jgi:hypothetical protein
MLCVISARWPRHVRGHHPRPLYYILLFTFAVAIFGSKFLTLFSFYQEINMVREMGMATITFWGFIIIVVTSGLIVTQELEDRTAVTLLSKPIQRTDFLLGNSSASSLPSSPASSSSPASLPHALDDGLAKLPCTTATHRAR